MDRADIDAIALRVVEMLADRERPRPLLTVHEIATELNVEASWVYANRERLGGHKLGPGRGAPIRFDLANVRRIVASGALERDPTRRTSRRRETPLPDGVRPLTPRKRAA